MTQKITLVACPDTGSYIFVQNGKLHFIPMNADGTADFQNAGEVENFEGLAMNWLMDYISGFKHTMIPWDRGLPIKTIDGTIDCAYTVIKEDWFVTVIHNEEKKTTSLRNIKFI